MRNLLNQVKTWWQRIQRPTVSPPATRLPPPERPAAELAGLPLTRLILADGVAHTLFNDYANHRRSLRGDEEIGWVLLGLRQEDQATALAALPAGMQREAGIAHVEFNRDAQELASRILRQKDKRLRIIGVVHTHPGGMRHPSEGDFQGDHLWVGQLRGGEGVFGIGTADARFHESFDASSDHQQARSELCFSWYVLGQKDDHYRPLPVQISIDADLAEPLHAVWEVLETHARPLNQLCRQLARVTFEVRDEEGEKMLAVTIPLAEPGRQLRLLLNDRAARYYVDRGDELIAVDPHELHLDRAIYLILAELAKTTAPMLYESPSFVES